MENILRELIKIDQKAKQIVAGAENNLLNVEDIIQVKSAEILSEIEANINAKIFQMRADSVEYINLKKAEIDTAADIQLAKLEADWNANSAKWREEIFRECIFRVSRS